MEINNRVNNGLGTYENAKLEKTERDRAKSKESSSETSSSRDTVNISDEALLRTDALQTATSTSDIRREKVEAIKAQIANGEYTIDTRKIATNLVRDDMALLAG